MAELPDLEDLDAFHDAYEEYKDGEISMEEFAEIVEQLEADLADAGDE